MKNKHYLSAPLLLLCTCLTSCNQVTSFVPYLNNVTDTDDFIEINKFQKMCESINKKSFNIMDLVLYGAKKIDGSKKRTRWYWDLEEFFESQ